MICIINSGYGNVKSILYGLLRLNCFAKIIQKPHEIPSGCVSLILPGVGSFETGISCLHRTGWYDYLADSRNFKDKSLIGICLGMQMLFSSSDESPRVKGLSLLLGSVVRFPSDKASMNIGWRYLIWNEKAGMETITDNALAQYYFNHCYFLQGNDTCVAALSSFGDISVPAVVKHSTFNIWGIQFHPEKSGKDGLSLVKQIITQSQDCHETDS